MLEGFRPGSHLDWWSTPCLSGECAVEGGDGRGEGGAGMGEGGWGGGDQHSGRCWRHSDQVHTWTGGVRHVCQVSLWLKVAIWVGGGWGGVGSCDGRGWVGVEINTEAGAGDIPTRFTPGLVEYAMNSQVSL